MADPDLGAERRRAPAGASPATNVARSSGDRRRLEILAAPERDRVRQRVDAADVARLAERDAEALSLADRVRRPSRRAPPPARRRRRAAARPRASSRRARAARRGSRRRARSRSPGSPACRPWRDRAARATARTSGFVSSPSGNRACSSWSWRRPYRKYVWSLSSSRARSSTRPAVRADLAARVVAGRDRLAVVQVARPAEQRPELHVRVAVDARDGVRPSR